MRILWLLAVIAQIAVTHLYSVTIGFQYPRYRVTPGSTVTIVTSLSEPITGGLEGYAIKLNYNAGTVAMAPEDIIVPGELNYQLFSYGSEKVVESTYASVAGFTQYGAPRGYYGTGFIVYKVTIPENAPLGIQTLTLEPLLPEGDNFVNGYMEVIDDTLAFGTTLLEVTDARPVETFDDLKVEFVNGQAKITFTGLAGWPYTIQVCNYSLSNWQTLEQIIPDTTGPVEYTDTTSNFFWSIFYRVVPGLQ